MEIRIRRKRESTKGLLSGVNWKLSSTITVALSKEEKSLVGHYYDPSVSANCVSDPAHIRYYYDGTDENYKQLDISEKSPRLGSFQLTVSVKGHEHVRLVQEFEKATVRALEDSVNHLKMLDSWEGESLVTVNGLAPDETATAGEPAEKTRQAAKPTSEKIVQSGQVVAQQAS